MTNVPVPTRKPVYASNAALNNNEGGVLNRIFDFGLNVFEEISDTEVARYTSKRLAQLRGGEVAAKNARDDALSGRTDTSFVSTSAFNDPNVRTLAMVAGVGVIGVAIYTLAKR